MKISNDRSEYYKLYHQLKMNDPSYAGKNYREKRREMAREYIKDRKNNPNYIKYHREYSKLWRTKNKKHTKDYNKTRPPYVWNLKQRFSKMTYDAKSRNLAVTLTLEEYENLTKLPCYLCGDLVISEHNGHGIDRVDNSIGYTLDNCRSCCGICNRMKRHYSIDDFINRIKKILNNYNGIEIKDTEI